MSDSLNASTIVLFNFIALTIASMLAFLEIPIWVFGGLFIIMVADVFFGVWKSFCLGKEVTSRRLISGMMGKAGGLVVILLTALVIKIVVFGFGAEFGGLNILFTFLGFVAIGELHSLWRNYIAVTKKIEVPEWSVWVLLANAISKGVEKTLEYIMKK